MKNSHQRSQQGSIYVTFIQMIVIFAGMPPYPCQQITSTVDVRSLCPGDVITLTCETRGSPLIAWRSIDYIGSAIGSQLEFDEFDAIGTTQTSLVYSTTVAELTSITRTPESNLVSQLRITIRSDVNSSSVICVHDNGNTDTITLSLLDTPGMIDIISDQRRNATGGCTVHYSWSPPSNVNINNINYFMVSFNGSSERVEKTEENVYMKEHSVCTCAAHSISITAINRCNHTGNSNNHVIRKEPVSQLDARCDGNAAMRIDPCPPCNCNSRDLIILSVVLGACLVISLAIIVLMFFGVIPRCPNPRQRKTSVSYEMPAKGDPDGTKNEEGQ